ncbi:MAG: DNA polymerase III subunit delta [Erysipelotrichaceae bacterium]|nr:DNA polymerase III subunit delta [Erysipelotrichaceae bacterium]
MIYMINGEEECFIRDKINEIIKNSGNDPIRFDGRDKVFSYDELIESCLGNSLFSSGSLVLVEEPDFLVRKVDDKKLEPVYNYVDNPVYETDLIFYTYQNNFNNRLKAFKKINENAQLITLNSYDYRNFNSYVRTRLNEEGLKLNNEAVTLLSNICKRSATLLNSNLEVLKLYPETITAQVINRLCSASDDNDSFELINALTSKDISKAISSERKLLNENDSALSVIGLLASQLRYLYQIAYYVSSGKKKPEIMELCNINEYRYNKAMATINVLDKRQIIELLYKLSDLDIKCKSDNSVSDSSRFELFILELLKK